MSIHWSSWGWDNGPLDPIDRYIFIKLADNADQDGHCYPSMPEIVNRTRFSESTVRRAIKNLERDGYLTVKHGQGKGHRSQYQLIKKVSIGKLSSRQDVLKKAPQKVSHGNLSNGNLSNGKLSNRPSKGVTQTNPPDPLIGVTVINRQKNPPVVPPQAGGPPEQSPPSLRASPRTRNPLAPVARQIGEHCGDISRRTLRAITQQLEIDVGRGRSAEDTAKAMKEAWEHLINFAHLLFYKPVPLAFYGNGMWRDDELWQWDQKKREQYRHATQGMR